MSAAPTQVEVTPGLWVFNKRQGWGKVVSVESTETIAVRWDCDVAHADFAKSSRISYVHISAFTNASHEPPPFSPQA